MSTHQQTKPAAEFASAVSGAYALNGAPVGAIRIHDGAISTIVKRTVLDIDGVARLSGSTLIDDLAELVHSKRMQDRSIQVDHQGGKLVISVAINPFFGFKFPVLIAEIKQKTADAVLSMTGIPVAAVHVDIRGIEEPPQSDDSAKESE